GYDRKMGLKRVALKVDIQKAYDTMNWQFLEDILIGFGFHERMVDWVMKCVTTTSFSVCVNGESCGYFKGGRGLRQGDPMSPYLFTLVMEILTSILREKEKWIISVSVLKEAIDEFGKVTGLIPNYNKSIIIFGCLNDEEKQEILEVILFKVKKLPIRYLGVPLTSRRIKHKECKSLIDKVESRVQNWKNKSLSYAGPFDVGASILESILCLLGLCFFYQMVVKQKSGLGLKDLGVWNRAMIVKHLWHVVTDKESLWVKWINTEKLKGRSFGDIEEDKNDS
ncbi:RNA-directed DNA polymerase, eukaryota, reverse transcriptase zinc-binding domain protein, partial [Tanacetum coccineum]